MAATRKRGVANPSYAKNSALERLLDNILRYFNINSAAEFGVSKATPILCGQIPVFTVYCTPDDEKLVSFPEDCDASLENYVEYGDIEWCINHVNPQYDLAILSTEDFNIALSVFWKMVDLNVPYIISRKDLGRKRNYTQRVFGTLDDKWYVYYKDLIAQW